MFDQRARRAHSRALPSLNLLKRAIGFVLGRFRVGDDVKTLISVVQSDVVVVYE